MIAPDRPARYRIETWGCQMNSHDSELMAGALSAHGMVPSESDSEADVILLNTCAIREKASEKIFDRLGRLRGMKKRRPGLVIGVCGCVAQMEQHEIFRRAPHVDFVMGPRHVARLPELVEEASRRARQIAVFDPRDRILPEPPETALRASRVKAFVTVIEGCNMSCTFCVVPMTRGRESCRPPAAIFEEVSRAVEGGLCEIELLGQTVNAYRSGGWDFTRLLAAVSRLPGVRRLRYATSHPLYFRRSVADLMGVSDVICPALHLPVQSGSNDVLQRMKRGYSRKAYLSKIAYARSRVPGIAISTDVIVGFPGETEGDFLDTLSLVEEGRFEQLYAFTYSSRRGTEAAALEETVAPEEASERLQRLFALQKEIQREINAAYVGRVEEILVEGASALDPQVLTGRTRTNRIVNFPGPCEWTGRRVDVRILQALPNSLRGIAAEGPYSVVPLTSIPSGDITRFV